MSPSPSPRQHAALALFCLASSCASDPYAGLKSENAGLGAVDPVTFPAENMGTDGNRMQSGAGYFQEVPANVAGEVVGYFAYPMKTPATRDPLRVLDDGKPYLATPTVYAFDATPEVPVPAKNKCAPPPGYHADKRLDPAPGWYTRQNNIFTTLPVATYNPGAASSTTYTPVVAQAGANSSGRVCQDLKSEKGLSTALGGKLPKPTANLLAWLIIDAGAAVYAFDDDGADPKTSIVLQKWGWYNRYLLAYLDGGFIPTAPAEVPINPMDPMLGNKPVTRMVTQKLYFPRGPIEGTDPATGMPAAVMGKIGIGYDVLTAKRGTEGYSPVCEVFSYAPQAPVPMGMMPAPFPEANLPKAAADIEMMFGAVMGNITPATPRYVFCLQVR